MKIRTGYSFRQAAGSLSDVMDRIEEIGWNVAPIADRASTFGFKRWSDMAEKRGLKPIFGVELAVAPDIYPEKGKPVVDYWSFFAIDDIRPINELVGIATEQFRYEPVLSYEQALSAQGVIRVTGHRPILEHMGDPQPTHTYVALGPSSARGLVAAARSKGWPFMASSDNRYPRADDRGFYEVLTGRNASTQSYAQHILSDEEWWDTFPDEMASKDKAINNRLLAFDKCNAKLKTATLVTPDRPKPLKQMCEEAAPGLGIDLSDKVYRERLDRELALIAEKEFEDYFYIVADVVQWARERMIVGPARGSSCGSLVCYLLKITTVDPIPFGLIFERFIDINRNDLPDIDIDFSDQERPRVFDYLNRKYGEERCARLGTVAMFQPRSAMQEVGAALRIPRWKMDKVAESLIVRSSGDSRALQTLEDTLDETPAGKDLMNDHPEARIATRFEGHPRHYSQHAAGVVISEEPMVEYVAVDHRTGATMCDKKDAEDGYNLLKIDALGLRQLSVFEDALELAGLPRDHLESLPLDDPQAFDVLNRGQFSGIFQFNGLALQSVTKQFTPDRFDDIVSITALGRPGPLASGGAEEWVRRRNGEKPVTFPHPVFEPFLSDTLGIVLYQEQVMEIGRQIGGLDWGQVTALRKAMSKSLGKEYFDQFGDPWKAGAIAKGVDPADAEKVWDDLCAYGAWSFNKSHSVAYGLISYWCCWLKAHHPFEFAAATLSHEPLVERQLLILRELAAEGYDYVPVDKDYSTSKWAVGRRDGKEILVGPLRNVKGIGPKLEKDILQARENSMQLPNRAKKLLDDPKTPLDTLWPIRDRIKKIMPDPLERNIVTHPVPIKDIDIRENEYDALVFCVMQRINPRDENEAVLVAKRGGRKVTGPTQKLNLFIADDTDSMFAMVGRFDYEAVGKQVVDRGRPDKAIYAVKGRIKGGGSFRMMTIKMIRYIGDMELDYETENDGGKPRGAGVVPEQDEGAGESVRAEESSSSSDAEGKATAAE